MARSTCQYLEQRGQAHLCGPQANTASSILLSRERSYWQASYHQISTLNGLARQEELISSSEQCKTGTYTEAHIFAHKNIFPAASLVSYPQKLAGAAEGTYSSAL